MTTNSLELKRISFRLIYHGNDFRPLLEPFVQLVDPVVRLVEVRPGMPPGTKEGRPARAVVARSGWPRTPRAHRTSRSRPTGSHRAAWTHRATGTAHRAHPARIWTTGSAHWRSDPAHVAGMASHRSSGAAHGTRAHHSGPHHGARTGMTDEARMASARTAAVWPRAELGTTWAEARMALRWVRPGRSASSAAATPWARTDAPWARIRRAKGGRPAGRTVEVRATGTSGSSLRVVTGTGRREVVGVAPALARRGGARWDRGGVVAGRAMDEGRPPAGPSLTRERSVPSAASAVRRSGESGVVVRAGSWGRAGVERSSGPARPYVTPRIVVTTGVVAIVGVAVGPARPATSATRTTAVLIQRVRGGK